MPASSTEGLVSINDVLEKQFKQQQQREKNSDYPLASQDSSTTKSEQDDLTDSWAEQILCNELFTKEGKYCKQSHQLFKKELDSKLMLLKMKESELGVHNIGASALNNSIINNRQPGSSLVMTPTKKEDQLEEPRTVLYEEKRVLLGWVERPSHRAGMSNMGNTCYLNSSLQALFHIPSFVNWLLEESACHPSQCSQNSLNASFCSLCAMIRTLKMTTDPSHSVIRPHLIVNKLKCIGKMFIANRQEDAHEFLKLLLDHMERSYLQYRRATKLDHVSRQTTPLNQIFGGYLRQQVSCPACHYISTTFSHFQDFVLDIRNSGSLDQALEHYFRKETLDAANCYKCERCKKKVTASKRYLIERPPNVLLLQLKRFTSTGGKIGKHVTISRFLDLSHFVTGASKFQPKSNGLNQNFNSDKSGNGIKYNECWGSTSTLTADCASASEGGLATYKYKLVSMVVHLGGSQHGGHYIACAEDGNGTMFEFDDSSVRCIGLQSALLRNPYILFYELIRRPSTASSKPINPPQQHLLSRQGSTEHAPIVRHNSDQVLPSSGLNSPALFRQHSDNRILITPTVLTVTAKDGKPEALPSLTGLPPVKPRERIVFDISPKGMARTNANASTISNGPKLIMKSRVSLLNSHSVIGSLSAPSTFTSSSNATRTLPSTTVSATITVASSSNATKALLSRAISAPVTVTFSSNITRTLPSNTISAPITVASSSNATKALPSTAISTAITVTSSSSTVSSTTTSSTTANSSARPVLHMQSASLSKLSSTAYVMANQKKLQMSKALPSYCAAGDAKKPLKSLVPYMDDSDSSDLEDTLASPSILSSANCSKPTSACLTNGTKESKPSTNFKPRSVIIPTNGTLSCNGKINSNSDVSDARDIASSANNLNPSLNSGENTSTLSSRKGKGALNSESIALKEGPACGSGGPALSVVTNGLKLTDEGWQVSESGCHASSDTSSNASNSSRCSNFTVMDKDGGNNKLKDDQSPKAAITNGWKVTKRKPDLEKSLSENCVGLGTSDNPQSDCTSIQSCHSASQSEKLAKPSMKGLLSYISCLSGVRSPTTTPVDEVKKVSSVEGSTKINKKKSKQRSSSVETQGNGFVNNVEDVLMKRIRDEEEKPNGITKKCRPEKLFHRNIKTSKLCNGNKDSGKVATESNIVDCKVSSNAFSDCNNITQNKSLNQNGNFSCDQSESRPRTMNLCGARAENSLKNENKNGDVVASANGNFIQNGDVSKRTNGDSESDDGNNRNCIKKFTPATNKIAWDKHTRGDLMYSLSNHKIKLQRNTGDEIAKANGNANCQYPLLAKPIWMASEDNPTAAQTVQQLKRSTQYAFGAKVGTWDEKESELDVQTKQYVEAALRKTDEERYNEQLVTNTKRRKKFADHETTNFKKQRFDSFIRGDVSSSNPNLQPLGGGRGHSGGQHGHYNTLNRDHLHGSGWGGQSWNNGEQRSFPRRSFGDTPYEGYGGYKNWNRGGGYMGHGRGRGWRGKYKNKWHFAEGGNKKCHNRVWSNGN